MHVQFCLFRKSTKLLFRKKERKIHKPFINFNKKLNPVSDSEVISAKTFCKVFPSHNYKQNVYTVYIILF